MRSFATLVSFFAMALCADATMPSRELAPAANMSVLTLTPVCYQCWSGNDIVGLDVDSAKEATRANCGKRCLELKQPCNAFTWTNYEGGTCWLKRFNGDQVTFKSSSGVGAFSGIVWRRKPDESCPAVYKRSENYDISGEEDMGNTHATNDYDCYKACRNTKDNVCKKFTWTNYNGGTCWMKKAGTYLSSPGMISGDVITPIKYSMYVEY